MINIAVTNEADDEPRIGLSPETAKKLSALGCKVKMLAGAGAHAHFSDNDYRNAGAEIAETAQDALKSADILLKVGRPNSEDLKDLKSGAMVVGILNPFDDRSGLEAIAKSGVTAFAMELMPRISRAQSMDVLSSQSNLAGYKAVIDAAGAFERALPMMMTAAGTVPPAKTFIMGAGVAGLQAVATARRLGAVVTSTDVRPAAKEQVQSLGAKFVAVEDDEFREAETAGGYAKEMSDDYKKKQAELIAKHIAKQDIVITTALIPGRPAPKLISKAMVESMPAGSVIFDLAAERGGNCELTKPGETTVANGVTIMGPINVAGQLPGNASSLYAKNLLAFLETMIDKEAGELKIDWDDEIVKGTLVARDGEIVHPSLTEETA